ncbi:MAG: phospholipid transport system substrate-binding protein [Granulosicoccus sp.]|jgi:phospholipid transport system substrate-binding protein
MVLGRPQYLFMVSVLLRLFVSLPLMFAVNVQAQPFDSEPHQLVHDTTEKVLLLLRTGIDPTVDSDGFVAKISEILDPVVAFDYIARGVLGRYGEGLSQEQQLAFAGSFKKGLVNTYGKGLSGFQELKIAVKAPSEALGDSRRTTVVQEITGSSGVTKVSYSMAKNRQGEWKMINLILSGINFGHTFRGQFAAAVEKNEGDVKKAIAEWEKSVL